MTEPDPPEPTPYEGLSPIHVKMAGGDPRAAVEIEENAAAGVADRFEQQDRGDLDQPDRQV